MSVIAVQYQLTPDSVDKFHKLLLSCSRAVQMDRKRGRQRGRQTKRRNRINTRIFGGFSLETHRRMFRLPTVWTIKSTYHLLLVHVKACSESTYTRHFNEYKNGWMNEWFMNSLACGSGEITYTYMRRQRAFIYSGLWTTQKQKKIHAQYKIEYICMYKPLQLAAMAAGWLVNSGDFASCYTLYAATVYYSTSTRI